MSKVDTIQLREIENKRLDANGSFSVVLDKPIILNKNDTLNISSCFLDNRSTASGRIEITEDNQDFQLSHGFYINNNSNNPDFTFGDDTSQPPVDRPDGQRYILAYGSVGTSDLVEITEFEFPFGGNENESFDGTFQFTPPHSDQPTTITLHFPKNQPFESKVKAQMPSKKGTKDFTLEGIIFKSTSGDTFNQADFDIIKPSFDELTDKYLVQDPGEQSAELSIVNINDSLFPLSLTFSFQIPLGSYSPDSLCKLITDKMVQYKHNVISKLNFGPDPDNNIVSSFPTRNAYLTSIKQLQTDIGYGIDSTVYANFYFVRTDGRSVLEIDRNAANNYVLGANEISLQFSPELNKFMFVQNHLNNFDADGNPSLSYIQSGTSGSNYFLSADHSGIFFQSMNASTHNLLIRDMGFTSDLLTIHQYTDGNIDFGTLLLGSRVFKTDLKVGKNITTNLSGVDASISKTVNFNIVPSFADLTDITTIEVSSIIAENNQQVSQLTDGYYLIAIEGLPKSGQFINNPNSQVKQIVSKYYATTDFVIGTTEGSILYQHTSDKPEYLTNFKIRVLDPNLLPANNLGPNNTVFLQHIHN
jgi:hypothetical protein